jgi:segregation and condensation protein B
VHALAEPSSASVGLTTADRQSNLGEEQPEDRRQRLEAILLIAREPLSLRKLAQLAGLADATEARTLSRQLNELYDRDGRAIRVEEVAGGYQLLTRPQFARWLRKLQHVPGEQRWTQSALETLALVAYRQPILRAELEAIRGVGCGEVLRQLMQRDLVKIVGRSEELGKPYLYGTTKRFLQLFGISSLQRSPRADWVGAVEFQLSEVSTDDGSDSTIVQTKLDDLRG